MKKAMKRLLSSMLVLAMVFVTTVSASAANVSENANPNAIHFSMDNVSQQDRDFLDKMSLVVNGFVSDNSGAISFTYTDEQLANNYGFTDYDLTRMNEIVSITSTVNLNAGGGSASTRMFVEDGVIYFDNADIHALLMTAATAGPAAIYAVIVALGTVTLGPVGTAIAAIVGLIGAPSLVSFCYFVIQGAINGQGVYLGIEMNGIFPNIICGNW